MSSIALRTASRKQRHWGRRPKNPSSGFGTASSLRQVSAGPVRTSAAPSKTIIGFPVFSRVYLLNGPLRTVLNGPVGRSNTKTPFLHRCHITCRPRGMPSLPGIDAVGYLGIWLHRLLPATIQLSCPRWRFLRQFVTKHPVAVTSFGASLPTRLGNPLCPKERLPAESLKESAVWNPASPQLLWFCSWKTPGLNTRRTFAPGHLWLGLRLFGLRLLWEGNNLCDQWSIP